jgi:trimeric autotransporter adhesin
VKRAVRLFPKLALLSVVACVGCSNTLSNPAPSLGSISPTSATAGAPGFTLTVKGGNFVFGSTVLWNGSTRVTTFISRSQLQAIIPPTDVQVPGIAKVQVVTGGPGGGKTASASFTIDPQTSSVPTITSLSPQSALAGGQQFSLLINGTNFALNSIATWNGSNLATGLSVLSNTQLQATVPAGFIVVAGTAQVGVLNPAPGGGLSNLAPFTIKNPLPSISSVAPASTQAGGATFSLTVNGSGFACAVTSTTTNKDGTTTTTCTTSASVINWNGSAQTTTFVNTSQLTASIDASLIASAQTAQVTVTNPPPGGGTSQPAVFNVLPSPSGGGLPELADISTAGIQASNGIGNPGRSGPVVTGGGRFIAFSSVSQNLVSGLTDNVANVFLHDACTGVTGCTPSTALASVATNGALSDADSLDPAVSADGRFVVFDSAATTLVPGVTSGVAQIYLRDTCTGAIGCTPSTTLVSVAPDGATAGDGPSSQPFVSPDGQFVIFASAATNLVSGVTIPAGAREIYLRTTCAGAASGCTPATTLVSVAPDGATPADGLSSEPVVVAGGRFVAFASTATNLVTVASGGIAQVYWRDTCTGASGCTPATMLVSVAPGGAAAGNAASSAPALGADGRFVAFASAATNLVSPNLPSGTAAQIFERDTCTGASGCTPATALVSVASDGSSPADAAAVDPAMDSTGRFVAFSSAASNIATAANSGQAQIFVRDTCAEASGCTPATALISQSASGDLGNASSSSPAVDAAGHFAAFVSFASNLVGNDVTPALDDVFLAVTTF